MADAMGVGDATVGTAACRKAAGPRTTTARAGGGGGLEGPRAVALRAKGAKVLHGSRSQSGGTSSSIMAAWGLECARALLHAKAAEVFTLSPSPLSYVPDLCHVGGPTLS